MLRKFLWLQLFFCGVGIGFLQLEVSNRESVSGPQFLNSRAEISQAQADVCSGYPGRSGLDHRLLLSSFIFA